MMVSYLVITIVIIERIQLSSLYVPDVVQNLTSDLGWNSAIFIYDYTTEMLFWNASLQQQHYNIDTIDLHSSLHKIHTLTFPHINIVIAVSSKHIRNIVKTIDLFDLSSNKTTDYRHHSKILILMNKASYHLTIQHLENVAVCILPGDLRTYPKFKMRCSTLIIHPHEHVFAPVSMGNVLGTLSEGRLFPNLAKGYNKRTILVSTLETPLYVIKQNISGAHFTYKGYLFDIWNIIVNKLNMSYKVVQPEDNNWGILENGRWNGFVGQLARREVDIAVADLTVTADRSEVIDFIFPSVMVDSTDIIYRREKSKLNTFSLLLGPLSSSVYLVLLSVWISTAMIYVLLQRGLKQEKDESDRASMRILAGSLWGFMATMLKQDFPMTPSSGPGKILLSSWWLLVLLISTAFCANLIAALSSQSGLSSLSSIEELVDSEYTTGILPAGVPYVEMQRSERPEIKRLFAKMIEANKSDPDILRNSYEMQMARVKSGGHSFISYEAPAAKDVSQDCELALMQASVTMADEYISFALPKGSPLKGDIETVLSNLRDTGILEHLWTTWTRSFNRTCDVSRDQTSISLREVSGGLLLVCAGLGLACAVLAVEICQKCSERKRTV